MPKGVSPGADKPSFEVTWQKIRKRVAYMKQSNTVKSEPSLQISKHWSQVSEEMEQLNGVCYRLSFAKLNFTRQWQENRREPGLASRGDQAGSPIC